MKFSAIFSYRAVFDMMLVSQALFHIF